MEQLKISTTGGRKKHDPVKWTQVTNKMPFFVNYQVIGTQDHAIVQTHKTYEYGRNEKDIACMSMEQRKAIALKAKKERAKKNGKKLKSETVTVPKAMNQSLFLQRPSLSDGKPDHKLGQAKLQSMTKNQIETINNTPNSLKTATRNGSLLLLPQIQSMKRPELHYRAMNNTLTMMDYTINPLDHVLPNVNKLHQFSNPEFFDELRTNVTLPLSLNQAVMLSVLWLVEFYFVC